MLLRIALILCIIKICVSWDADDLALFDVVEDVGQNFYELLDVDQRATPTEIRRAYRRVSLQLHPDKNKDPDAENQFRKLVAAYEVLKDDKMREKYDDILVTGLPDWRQPVFYYRKVKKMGLVETSVLMSIILTVGHLIVSWVIYLEKKFVYEEVNRGRRKKDKKSRKQKTEEVEVDPVLQEDLDQLIPKPKFSDMLPVLIVRGVFWMLSSSPSLLLCFVDSLRARFGKSPEGDPSEGEEENEDGGRLKLRKPRPANNFTYELAEPTELNSAHRKSNVSDGESLEDLPKPDVSQKSGEWQEMEIELLVKAIVKFPGGTTERWEKISAMVGRSVKEVTNMSKKLKTSNAPAMSELNARVLLKRDTGSFLRNVELSTPEVEPVALSSPLNQLKPQTAVIIPTPNSRHIERTLAISLMQPKVIPPSSSSLSSLTTNPPAWTQQHQKLLEAAMTKVPKFDPDRWDKIASLVPGKTKEECLQRVRHLAEVVKKKKLEQQTPPAIEK